MMLCSKCGDSVKDGKLLKHLREYHNEAKDLNITCCGKLLNTVPTYQKHWYSTHHVSKKKTPVASSSAVLPLCDEIASDNAAFDTNSDGTTSALCNVPEVVPNLVDSDNVVKRARVELTESDESVHNLVQPPRSEENELMLVSEGSTSKYPEFIPESVVIDSASGPDFHVVTSLKENDETVLQSMDAPSNDPVVILDSVVTDSFVVEDCSNSSDIEENPDSDLQIESSESSESEESEGEAFQEGVVPIATKCEDLISVNENAANFLLHLKEKCNIPIKSTREVLTQTETLIKGALHDFASKVDAKLQSNINMSLDSVLSVNDTVESTTNAVFNNLRTNHLQNKYFKEKLGVIEPARYPLGRQFRRVRRKRKFSMQTVIVQEEFIAVPIDGVVEKLVGHPDYKRFSEEGSLGGNSDVLDSYMKGEHCKKNSVLREHPDALRFVLYYDDLEVCAPLKSKAGKHKIGAFYMHLDNVPLKYRSNLDMIFVVGLVNANLVKGKNYGMDAALHHIVNSLKKFEDGIILKNGKKVYGTLIAVIGDNLGSHAISGFKEGFTAHRYCRYCSATYEQTQTMTSEDVNLLRDKTSHSEQCAKVQTSRGKNEALSTKFGVNRDSILNELRSYHVIEGLPADFLHDGLEGALPLTVKKFLHHHLYVVAAKERKFTLDWLNAAICDFDYGYSEVTDKPSELKKDYITDHSSASLHQSGCQMWMLATILPLILGPYMDVHDKYFQNLLDLLEICRIVFASEINKWMVVYLKDLIEIYLTNYIELYGSLIPKQHFLLHYPTLITLLGPLVNYLCMRSEAKHKYFKKIVNMLGNYKHIPFTLCQRHQLSQGVAWSKSLFRAPKVGPFSWKYVSELSYGSLLGSAGPSKVIEAAWLQFSGVKFVQEKCFICVGSNDSMPVFAKIMKVLIYPHCQFVCQKVLTRVKNVHLAAYQVELLSDFCIVKPQEMILHKVFHPHRVLGKDFIVMKQCAKDALF